MSGLINPKKPPVGNINIMARLPYLSSYINKPLAKISCPSSPNQLSAREWHDARHFFLSVNVCHHSTDHDD